MVMAVDNLPASLPVDASRFFGQSLVPFVQELADAAQAGPSLSFDALSLSSPLERAWVLHQGQFTPPFEYMREYVS